jgi:hypothetical protein
MFTFWREVIADSNSASLMIVERGDSTGRIWEVALREAFPERMLAEAGSFCDIGPVFLDLLFSSLR